MKIPVASFLDTGAAAGRLLGVLVLLLALLAETGCVSQRAYQQARAEADELTRSLHVVRDEVRVLGLHADELQAANREEENATAELRTAIQREEDSLPVLRKRAHEKLALLNVQVAHLVSQSRLLARQIADAKQERASLKVLVAQYKKEAEDAPPLPEPIPATASVEAPSAPVDSQAEAHAPVSVATPAPVPPPQQMAQVTPVTPVKPPGSPHPTPTEAGGDSLIDTIMTWVLSLWNWILALFS
jgi:hypothetical protein